jgi:hypothetical protein
MLTLRPTSNPVKTRILGKRPGGGVGVVVRTGDMPDSLNRVTKLKADSRQSVPISRTMFLYHRKHEH